MTLLEMTSAYGVLANAGLRVTPYLVSEIRDQRGAVLYRAPAGDTKRVYDAAASSIMTAMLANVVSAGTGVQAKVPGWQIAGKIARRNPGATLGSWVTARAWFAACGSAMTTTAQHARRQAEARRRPVRQSHDGWPPRA